jgi:hypothetical protein
MGNRRGGVGMGSVYDSKDDLVLPAFRGDWHTVGDVLAQMDLEEVEVVAEVLQRLANRANHVYYAKLSEAYDRGAEE